MRGKKLNEVLNLKSIKLLPILCTIHRHEVVTKFAQENRTRGTPNAIFLTSQKQAFTFCNYLILFAVKTLWLSFETSQVLSLFGFNCMSPYSWFTDRKSVHSTELWPTSFTYMKFYNLCRTLAKVGEIIIISVFFLIYNSFFLSFRPNLFSA